MAGVQGMKRGKARPQHLSQQLVLEAVSKGVSLKEALASADRSLSWYKTQRRDFPDFASQMDRLRSEAHEQVAHDRAEGFPDFPTFSDEYLGARVFPHMLNVVDLIEGRPPRWTHPSMLFEPGERDLVLVNMPPEHAKSTAITMNYVTYRIAQDPNIRVIIVSKTADMARKFLRGIKERLTHPRYARMHVTFGPPGGFQQDALSWSQDMIYINPAARDSGEKDPTVQALGIRGQIYGSRADLIVIDDAVDLSNAHDYEKQIAWIQGEVMSRIATTGSLLVVGTRLAPRELYLELRDEKRYPDDVSPWTYLSMPAVLEFAEDPNDWVTLWPKSNQPEPGARGEAAVPDADGLYRKWDGPALKKKRARLTPRTWSIVYQQETVSEQAVFSSEAVQASVNGNRMTGQIPRGMVNCRPNGMEGLTVVAGLDPATAGHTAAVVIGLDVQTQKRYVLDMFNQQGISPDAMRAMIFEFTDRYNVCEWRVEKNGFQGFLTEDREVNEYLNTRGCRLVPHFTGQQKLDPDFGVASMSTLFSGWEEKRQLIELPSTAIKEACKALVSQLVTWQPQAPKAQKTDLVMSLWFAELACRDRIALGSNYRRHVDNPWLTPWDRQQRQVINLLDAEARELMKPVGAY